MSKISKKFIAAITVLACAVVMVGPGMAQALTADELQTQINALMAQLATLQSELATIQGTTPATTTTIEGCDITSFDRNLKQGMSGDDVKCLQIIMNSDVATKLGETGAGSPGSETKYFGPITKAGVIKFQTKYADEVLASWGLTTGTGFVGSTTRAKLNDLLTATPAVVAPVTGLGSAATITLSGVPVKDDNFYVSFKDSEGTVICNPLVIANSTDNLSSLVTKLTNAFGSCGTHMTATSTGSVVTVTAQSGVSFLIDDSDMTNMSGSTLAMTAVISEAVVDTTPPVGCDCTAWANTTCGAGTCTATQMQQTRTCTPSACAAETQCVSDTSCVVATDGLTVVLSSTTPAAAVVPLSSLGVPFTTLKVEGQGSITKMVIKRKGLGSKDDFAGIALYEGDNKLTLSRTLTSTDEVTFNLSTPIEIVSGVARYITIAADIATDANGGNINYLEITSLDDIIGDVTISGTFPISGNSMSIGGVSVGQIKAEMQTTSDTTINVGEQNQELGRYKFTAETTLSASSAEDIKLKAIRFKQVGSADLSDMTNFKLYKAGTEEMTEVAVAVNGEYINFSNIDTTITKGNYVRFVIKADVISGGSQNIKFQIEENSDITTTGLTYGYGAYVHDGNSDWDEVNGTEISIAAGELSFSVTGPSAQTVTTKEDNIVAAEITITAADASLITKMYATIDGTDPDDDTTMEDSIESVRLQRTDGSITYDAVVSADDSDDHYEFYFANVDVPEGISTWRVIFNTIDSATDADDSYQFALNASSSTGTSPESQALSAMTAKNSQGKSITDVKPGSVVTGNSITLSAAALTVTKISMDNTDAVGSTKDIAAIKLQVKAGSSDDITITQMAFENASTTTATGSTEMSNFSLYKIEGTTETLLQSGVSPSASTTTFSVTFGQINSGQGISIPKGAYVQLVVKFDTNSSITDGRYLYLKASDTDWGITARNSIGDELVDAEITDSVEADDMGRKITFHTKGTVTITKEDVLTDIQVLGGSTGISTLQMKFDAAYEDIAIKKLIVDAPTAVGDSVANVYLYNGSDVLATASFAEATATATFGDGNTTIFTVDKDTDTIITVKTDFRAVGTGENTADSGDEIVWTMSHDGVATPHVVATGASSNSDLTLSATYDSSDIKIGGNADIASDTYHVRRAMIANIVAADDDTHKGTQLSSGTANFKVFAFTITVAEDVSGNNHDDAFDLSKLKLTVSGGSDLASNALTNAQIYRTDVPTTKINVTNASTTYLEFVNLVVADQNLSDLRNIKPGESATFVIEADLPTMTDCTTADTLQLSIGVLGGQSEEGTVDFSEATAGHVVWSDRDTLASADNTSWIGFSGIAITDIKGPLFTGPQQ